MKLMKIDLFNELGNINLKGVSQYYLATDSGSKNDYLIKFL